MEEYKDRHTLNSNPNIIFCSKALDVRSKALDVHPKALNVRSKLLNGHFSCFLQFFCLWLAFAFYVFFHKHVLAIEYGIGELPYPIAENHEAGFLAQHEV